MIEIFGHLMAAKILVLDSNKKWPFQEILGSRLSNECQIPWDLSFVHRCVESPIKWDGVWRASHRMAMVGVMYRLALESTSNFHWCSPFAPSDPANDPLLHRKSTVLHKKRSARERAARPRCECRGQAFRATGKSRLQSARAGVISILSLSVKWAGKQFLHSHQVQFCPRRITNRGSPSGQPRFDAAL
jgi:hypothetical protein